MSAPQTLTHMSRHDERVFATYLFTQEGQTFDTWEFDVLVGDPDDPGAHYPANSRYQALYVNALKIDAIGWFFNSPTLIECKSRAGLGAIGQAITYQQWFQQIFAIPARTLIVCTSMSRQCQTSALWNRVDVQILPPASDFQVIQAKAYVKPRIQKRSIMPQLLAASSY